MLFSKLFSERQKEVQSEVLDEYRYETIPDKLRIQVIHIWRNAIGELRRDAWGQINSVIIAESYEEIHEKLCFRYGKFRLGKHHGSAYESVCTFFLQTKDIKEAIDVIEVSFQYIDEFLRGRHRLRDQKISPDEAISALNNQFKEHGVGYQYESGQINRIDSEFIHSEAMKPALRMLSDSMYEGANDEFLKAHEHYRAGRYKECMNECSKAFESCIKAICDKRGWNYGKKGGIHLIKIVLNEGLIEPFMESHFAALRKALVDGAFTPRNQRSGHGQGSKIIPVPDYMAAYALHLTASNILLLAKADEEMK